MPRLKGTESAAHLPGVDAENAGENAGDCSAGLKVLRVGSAALGRVCGPHQPCEVVCSSSQGHMCCVVSPNGCAAFSQVDSNTRGRYLVEAMLRGYGKKA